jgi:hypothetical protein
MRRYLAPLVVLCSLLAAPAALASGTQVIQDCNVHGQLTRHYSNADLNNALATMPSTIKEYTDCQDVIQRQLLAQLGSPQRPDGVGTGQGSSGSFLPTPLIVVLVVLALAAATLGAIAVRRRN